MGGFDLVAISLASWIFGFLRGYLNSFWMKPVVGIKWG
jgi:hypothetical protein